MNLTAVTCDKYEGKYLSILNVNQVLQNSSIPSING